MKIWDDEPKEYIGFWDWVERKLEPEDDSLPECADVVIGLGSALEITNEGMVVASRASRAIAKRCRELYEAGRAENILFAGGYTEKGITEAEAMAAEIVGMVPKEHVGIEYRSQYTFQNADYLLPLMWIRGWKSAIIVTRQWHARRARMIFRKRWAGQGIAIAVIKERIPYTGSTRWRDSHFLLAVFWDFLALIMGKLRAHL